MTGNDRLNYFMAGFLSECSGDFDCLFDAVKAKWPADMVRLAGVSVGGMVARQSNLNVGLKAVFPGQEDTACKVILAMMDCGFHPYIAPDRIMFGPADCYDPQTFQATERGLHEDHKQ